MEWDKALAELLLEEPEIRSWLGLDPFPPDATPPRRVDGPAALPARPLQPRVAA